MIDWEQVRQLEDDIGTEDFGEVVALFIAEVNEAVAKLTETPPTNAGELTSAMHFLKGSAYNLGFKSFGDYCGQEEARFQNGYIGDIDLGKIIDLYEQSKDVFFVQATENCSFEPE